jgi:hypothetical protein
MNLAQITPTINPERRPYRIFRGTTDTVGTAHEWTFDQFAQTAQAGLAQENADKRALPAFGIYALGDQPSAKGSLAVNENVLSISCVGIDYDNGTEQAWAHALIQLVGISAFWYGTPSDGPQVKRRLFIETDRPLKPHELNPLRDSLVLEIGIAHDPNARDARRYYFVGKLPGTPDRAFGRIEGEPLSVDDWLALNAVVIPEPSVTREPTLRNASGCETDGFDHAAVIALLEPRYVEPHKHGIARGLGGYLLKRGYTQSDAERIVSELPGDGARVDAALWNWTAESPAGYSTLKCHLPPDALGELERLVPDLTPQGRKHAAVKTIDVDNFAHIIKAPPAPDGAPPSSKPREANIAGLVNILRADPAWAGVLGYDQFACRTVALREPPMREVDRPNAPTEGNWTEAHTMRARAWFTEAIGDEPGKDATDSAIDIGARANTFHPVRTYLDALKWDGAPRLNRALSSYFGVPPTTYAALVGAKFLISAVARVYDPGCKVDTMLILEGPQGTKKSTAVRVLASPPWFADTALDFDSKDAAQCLQGKWIYEIGELASFNRGEVNRIKAFVSSPSDNLRPSYGRRNEDYPRQCVFVGTTNDKHYLTDTTGNRRYWPVSCGAIDVEALRRDRDQLWAEARDRYRAGELWYLVGEEVTLAAVEQAERESEDPWQALLVRWCASPLCSADGFTVGEALVGACGVAADAQTQAQATRVGRLLAKLGYVAGSRRDPSDWKKVGPRRYRRAA